MVVHFVVKICECVEYKVEYDYAGNVMMCLPCFENQDGETQIYNYFKNKYNEELTLEQIQQIIKTNLVIAVGKKEKPQNEAV